MAILERFVKVVRGSGGPLADGIPAYGDHNAPKGSWATDSKGNQIIIKNGTELVIADGRLIFDETVRKAFFNDSGYARVWGFNPIADADGRHGFDLVPGQNVWVEASHLEDFKPEPTPGPGPGPEPEPTPEPEPEVITDELAAVALLVLIKYIKQM